MKYEIGKCYKTVGGWKAKCVYVNIFSDQDLKIASNPYAWFVHIGCVPSNMVIPHDFYGKNCEQVVSFGYHAPTNYCRVPHPADLTEEELDES